MPLATPHSVNSHAKTIVQTQEYTMEYHSAVIRISGIKALIITDHDMAVREL